MLGEKWAEALRDPGLPIFWKPPADGKFTRDSWGTRRGKSWRVDPAYQLLSAPQDRGGEEAGGGEDGLPPILERGGQQEHDSREQGQQGKEQGRKRKALPPRGIRQAGAAPDPAPQGQHVIDERSRQLEENEEDAAGDDEHAWDQVTIRSSIVMVSRTFPVPDGEGEQEGQKDSRALPEHGICRVGQISPRWMRFDFFAIPWVRGTCIRVLSNEDRVTCDWIL